QECHEERQHQAPCPTHPSRYYTPGSTHKDHPRNEERKPSLRGDGRGTHRRLFTVVVTGNARAATIAVAVVVSITVVDDSPDVHFRFALSRHTSNHARIV